MPRQTRTILFAASLLSLAGCETLNNAPTVFGSTQANPCPTLATGPAPLTSPFPDACDEMVQASNGLKWIELTDGGPSEKGTPTADSTVVVSYEGFLAADGTPIFSSFVDNEADVFAVADMVTGWGQVVQNMSPGDEWLIYVPSELAYGDEAYEDVIPANSDLVFRTRLDGFLTAQELAAIAAERKAPAPDPEPPVAEASLGPDMAAWSAFYPWDADAPGVNKLKSGVSYVVLERGNSTSRNALRSDTVVVHYEGRLAANSNFFDSSWSRGEPAVFPVGGLIPGFTEVLTYMRRVTA